MPDPDSPIIHPKNRGLRDTLVWLVNEDAKDQTPLPIHPNLRKVPVLPVAVEIINNDVSPHLVALRQGQPLLIENNSPVAQQVSLVGRWTNVVALPLARGVRQQVTNLVPERLPMCLSAQPWTWLRGRVAVFAHPYFAVTDADGAYVIRDAPAGKFRMVIWSYAYNNGAKGRLGEPVTIRVNGTADLGDIAFNPPPALLP